MSPRPEEPSLTDIRDLAEEQRRDAVDDLGEIIDDLLRIAHTDTVTPRGSAVDIRAGRITGSSDARAPAPGDRQGWERYRWAVHKLVEAQRALQRDYHPGVSEYADWTRHAPIARTVRAHLDARAVQVYGPDRVRRACALVCKAHQALARVAGWQERPPDPECETPLCDRQPDRRMPDGTWRCGGCHRHFYRVGAYPDIRHVAG